jgi:protein O-GlcNAc transferase
VGLVSGDLREHVVGFFRESLLRDIYRGRIELIAYPTQPAADQVSQHLRAHVAARRPLVGLTDAEATAHIHADGVHVLLGLSGHTVHNRLPMFAYKPTPVQASWLGYLATTGANPWTLPITAEASFTEKIWRFLETYLCFTPLDVDVLVLPPPGFDRGTHHLRQFQFADENDRRSSVAVGVRAGGRAG